MILLISMGCGLVCFTIMAVIISRRVKARNKLIKRMEFFANSREAGLSLADENDSPFVAKAKRIIKKGAAILQRFQKSGGMDLKMQQADWPILGSEFKVILLGAGLLAGIFLGLLMMKPMGFVVGFVVAPLLGMMILDFSIVRRRKAFVNQLADMLTMVANALRAGFSFIQAMELISREMEPPVSREVAKLIREVNVGMSLEQALDNMNKRICNPEFELIATAVLIQRQVGGNLAQILDTISETINERIRMRREVMALTAQGRMSAIVMAILPIALAAVLMFINPNYMKPLFEETMGQIAIGVALAMEVMGYIVINKIVDIDI